MLSDIDEDFPINGSDKLAKLFEENAFPDISFKLLTSKHPSSRPKPSQPHNVPLRVFFAKTVEAFQMKIGGYMSEGKVGLAIIGSDEYSYYQIYMYRSDEKKMASAEISFNFGFIVQEHNYATFKDGHNILWSVHFDKSVSLISFCKEVALARWKSTKSHQDKLVQEAFKGKIDVVAKKTDLLSVSYRISTLSPFNILQEETKTHVTAPANASTWETNLIGACLKSKRFVIIPSHLCSSLAASVPVSNGFHLLIEMELEEVIPLSLATASDPPVQSSPNDSSPPQTSMEKKEEGESLSGRMARIGYALPSRQEGESNITPSTSATDRAKDASAKPLAHNSNTSSNMSMQSKEEMSCLLEPSDLSTTSQFNVLFSEVRTSNAEIRMNINRITDKVDSVISKMDFVPNLNHKIIPTVEKFQNLDGVLNKLLDQNSAIMSLLEKNSPSKLESTLNEMIQLKKRNAELESFLEVSGSTSQILKDKVAELTQKIFEFEATRESKERLVCSNCSGEGDGKIKSLEASLKNLQEKNYSLLKNTEQLEKQNKELLSKMSYRDSTFEAQLKDKDEKIMQLQMQIEKFNLKASPEREAVNKEITDVVRGLMNRIYKLLKEELKDTTNDNIHLDQTIANILRVATRDYLETHIHQPKISQVPNKFEEGTMSSLSDAPQKEEQGNLSFCPSKTPLPVPKPRKPTSAVPMDQSRHGTEVPVPPLHLPQTEPVISTDNPQSENSLRDPNSNDAEPNDVTILNQSGKVTASVDNDESGVNILIANKKNSNENLSFEDSGSSVVPEAVAISREPVETPVKEENVTSHVYSKSSDYNPYASTHYTPLLPTTPPPIFDDSSDDSQES